jgi:peptide/nickel transport system substrate-binding protein
MGRNEGYWDENRIPKLAKLVLIPMPEATTRLAALRSGQVDWIEVPPPDAIPSLKAAGFQISLWPYPHIWPYILNMTEGSVFHDKRLRQALDYAIDRDAVAKFLNGTAKPAYGVYPPDNLDFGKPEQHYGYDPDKAKELLKEAGYGPDHPVKAKVMISTSGSGQMMPPPMNEIIQQQVKPIGFDLDFDVVDWGTMLVVKRSASTAPASHGVDALNNSLGFADPASMFRYFSATSFSPKRHQLGPLQRAARAGPAQPGTGKLRYRATDRIVGKGPCDRRRRRRVGVHRARSEPARDVAQGQGLPACAKLVSGLH